MTGKNCDLCVEKLHNAVFGYSDRSENLFKRFLVFATINQCLGVKWLDIADTEVVTQLSLFSLFPIWLQDVTVESVLCVAGPQ